jgi:hypothetical protein
MLRILPDSGRRVNPHLERRRRDTAPVSQIDVRQVLWANVQALMEHHWRRVSLAELSRKAHIGLGSVSRIKEQETSVGVDIVAKVADVFHLEAWQLLVPGLDPKNPPTLMPVGEAERRLYERLAAAAREFKKSGH